jgi:hypothetical protein
MVAAHKHQNARKIVDMVLGVTALAMVTTVLSYALTLGVIGARMLDVAVMMVQLIALILFLLISAMRMRTMKILFGTMPKHLLGISFTYLVRAMNTLVIVLVIGMSVKKRGGKKLLPAITISALVSEATALLPNVAVMVIVFLLVVAHGFTPAESL